MGGGTGGKRRGREEGRPKAEGGLRLIFSSSPALSCCFSHRALDPVSGEVMWWLEKLQDPQTFGFHQKIQFSGQINLSDRTHVPTGMQIEKRWMRSRLDFCQYFLKNKLAPHKVATLFHEHVSH